MRSSEVVKAALIKSIIEGQLKINDSLLPERELSIQYGVGRPTIREALQSLENDGWITARKGMPALVNDIWKKGNLMTIVNILQYYEKIPDAFVEYMLDLRVSLTPSYMRDAVSNHPMKVASLFAGHEILEDEAGAYAHFDWELQKQTTALASNPIYLFILNSFKDIYLTMATRYFEISEHRFESKKYYADLVTSIMSNNLDQVEISTIEMMKRSLELWKNRMKGRKHNEKKGIVS